MLFKHYVTRNGLMVANARHVVHTAVARTDVFAVNDVVQTEAHFVIGK